MSLCQQMQLYAAEWGVPGGHEFDSVPELQGWVDALRDEPWWDRFNPQVLRVDVGSRPNGSGSVGAWFPEQRSGRIEMEPNHMHELVVLHELAHVLAGARHGSTAHDPWFARTYLEIVSLVMGSSAFDRLRASFDEHNVDHEPPRSKMELGRARFEL